MQTHGEVSGGRELCAGDSSVMRAEGTGWPAMAEYKECQGGESVQVLVLWKF